MGDAADYLTEQGSNYYLDHKLGICEGECPYCEEKMSIGPTWALCNDGKFYKEPVWRGENFFLCFDEDEPPELVIKKPSKLTLALAKSMALEILKMLGIEADIREDTYFGGGSRCFTKELNGFHKAFRFFLKITERPPPPHEYRGTPTDDRSKLDGTFYHFGTDLQAVLFGNPAGRK